MKGLTWLIGSAGAGDFEDIEQHLSTPRTTAARLQSAFAYRIICRKALTADELLSFAAGSMRSNVSIQIPLSDEGRRCELRR